MQPALPTTLSFRDALLTLAVMVVWGTNFVVIHIGVEHFPPLLFAALRFTFALLPAAFFLKRPDVPWSKFAAYGESYVTTTNANASANNLHATNQGGEQTVTSRQSNTAYVRAQAEATSATFGAAQATAYGVGNSMLAGGVGPEVTISNTQDNSGGGVDVVATFGGGSGYDAASTAIAFGNAATRLEAFVAAGGTYVYGSYPDIDGLFREQAAALDPKRREATLHRIQQLVHDRVIYAPIWQLAFLNGVGPRIEHSGLGTIAGFAYSAPYEDVKLKK